MDILRGLKLNNIEELQKYNLVILEDLGIDIENNIDKILKERKIKPADLARMTGIARQNINEIIKGKLTPGVNFALKIAISLNTTVEELFSLKEDAWIRRLSDDNNNFYLDMYNLEIKDGKIDKDIKKSKDYIILEENRVISEESYKEMQNKYYEHNYERIYKEILAKYPNEVKQRQKSLTKIEIDKEFNKICTNRYKKLGMKLTPSVK